MNLDKPRRRLTQQDARAQTNTNTVGSNRKYSILSMHLHVAYRHRHAAAGRHELSTAQAHTKMKATRSAMQEVAGADWKGGNRAREGVAARTRGRKDAGATEKRNAAHGKEMTDTAPSGDAGTGRPARPGDEAYDGKTSQRADGRTRTGSARRGDVGGTGETRRSLSLKDEVPLGRTFRARCGQGLGRTELFYVGNQKDVGVTGLRTWPRGGAKTAPAFRTGETVAYFVERTHETKRVGIIAGRGQNFEYDQERSTAYRINTTIRGHGKKSENTDMGKAPCRAKVDGRTYWRVFATRDIQHGEALRVPYRDKRHISEIKRQIGKQTKTVRSTAVGEARKAWDERRRKKRAHLTALNKAKQKAVADAKRGAREQRKRERAAKWQGEQRRTRSRAGSEIGTNLVNKE